MKVSFLKHIGLYPAFIELKKELAMKEQKLKVVTLIHEIFEDLEMWYPVIRLREENIEVVLAGEEKGKVYTGKHGLKAKSDLAYSDLKAEDFDGVLVPGGFAPDKLRRSSYVLHFVKQMNHVNKPIGQICHAGWVLISANILKGKTVTSTPAIKDDMKNAGATWVNEPIVVSENIVSSRNPNDLHVYVPAFIKRLKK
jgi:protease I